MSPHSRLVHAVNISFQSQKMKVIQSCGVIIRITVHKVCQNEETGAQRSSDLP